MSHICPTCFRPLEPSEEIEVSLEENVLIWKGIVCHLRPKEAEVLAILARGNPMNWKSAGQIIQGLYGLSDGPEDADQALRSIVWQIRQKLKSMQIPIVIENSRRIGDGRERAYRLKYGY